MSNDCKVNVAATGNLTSTRIVGVDKSHSLEEGMGKIDGVSLDSYLNGKCLTLLKVDVEGSESELLRGGQNSIHACRPRIALSVYHYPTDIFRLLGQIKEINPDYRISLGHHSSQLMETVTYCRDQND